MMAEVERRPVLCPKCKSALGMGVYRNGEPAALDAGNVRLFSADGVCMRCGASFRFRQGRGVSPTGK